MTVTAMKFRHRTVAGGPASADAGGGSRFPSEFFQIDARIGHAWFARPDAAKVSVEPRQETLPALRQAELALSHQGRAVARRPRRVPSDAIVSLGATLASARRESGEPSAGMGSVANDNVPYLSSRTRTLLREITFLAIFVATLAGTYYLGRTHSFHNVIVVPDAGQRANRIVDRFAGPERPMI